MDGDLDMFYRMRIISKELEQTSGCPFIKSKTRKFELPPGKNEKMAKTMHLKGALYLKPMRKQGN